MIEAAYLYVLIALIYLSQFKKLNMDIFLVSIVMILQIVINVSSVIDLAFACIYGYLALQAQRE